MRLVYCLIIIQSIHAMETVQRRASDELDKGYAALREVHCQEELCKELENQGADTELYYQLSCWAKEVGLRALPRTLKDVTMIDTSKGALIWAVRNNQYELVELLLANGAKAHSWMGIQSLLAAAEFGHRDCVRLLLDAGVPIDGRSTDGLMALHVATQNLKFYVVKFLLDRGATINAAIEYDHELRDDIGWTALHIAVGKSSVEIAQLLIEKGAHLDAGDVKKRTPLAMVKEAERPGEVKKLLVECGAEVDVNVFLDSDWEVFPDSDMKQHCAADKNWSKIHQYAAQGDVAELHKVLSRTKKMLKLAYHNAFMTAVANGHRSVVIYFLTHDGRVNYSLHKTTALHVAACWNQCEIAQLLIENSARVDALDNEYRTPLQVALLYNNLEVARLLKKDTQLHESDVCEVLAQKSNAMLELLDETFIGEHGAVLLEASVEASNTEALGFLLYDGALESAVNSKGEALLHKANHRSVVRLLLWHGANVDVLDEKRRTPLHYAAQKNLVGVARELMLQGASINVQDSDGMTPLHHAVSMNAAEVVRLLVDHGALCSLKNKRELTPYDRALKAGRRETVQALFVSGTQCLAINKEEDTALHFGAREGRTDIISALLEKGVDVSVQNSAGLTALHEAYSANQREVVELLLPDTNLICFGDASKSFERIVTILCCLRTYGSLPRDIVFHLLFMDDALLMDMVNILYHQSSVQSRKPYISIRNTTPWRLRVSYSTSVDRGEAVVVPGDILIIEEQPYELTSLKASVYGDVQEWSQLKPLDILETMQEKNALVKDYDVGITITGSDGLLTQFIKKFGVECKVSSMEDALLVSRVPLSRSLKDAFPCVKFFRKKYPDKEPSMRYFLNLPKEFDTVTLESAYQRLKDFWEGERIDHPENASYVSAVLGILASAYEALVSEKTVTFDLDKQVPAQHQEPNALQLYRFALSRLVNKKPIPRSVLTVLAREAHKRREERLLSIKDGQDRTPEMCDYLGVD